jgi:hypothetical protein
MMWRLLGFGEEDLIIGGLLDGGVFVALGN